MFETQWKLCPSENCVIQDLSLWVLFKVVCCKSFEFVSFRTAEIIKFEKCNLLQSKNSFYGKVAPHLFSHIYSSGWLL